jgi:hypothetical protein
MEVIEEDFSDSVALFIAKPNTHRKLLCDYLAISGILAHNFTGDRN